MTQPTKPSVGALRAAEIIRYIRIQAPHGDRHQLLDLIPILRDGTPSDSTMESTMAHIIDREIGVAELLEAAIKAHSYLQGVRTGGEFDEADVVERLQQAIAKYEGK